jgi:hypothetical protein
VQDYRKKQFKSEKASQKRGEKRKKKEAEHSRFLLVEPLLDETEERLWLALEQLRVIFTLEEVIVELAPPEGRLCQTNRQS